MNDIRICQCNFTTYVKGFDGLSLYKPDCDLLIQISTGKFLVSHSSTGIQECLVRWMEGAKLGNDIGDCIVGRETTSFNQFWASAKLRHGEQPVSTRWFSCLLMLLKW